MKGEFVPSSPLRYTQILLPPRGDGRIISHPQDAEFARVAPAVVGRRHRYVYTLGSPAEPVGWIFRTVVRRDLETGAIETFDYGPGRTPEEHLFVPKPGGIGEDDGWLIGTVLDWEADLTGLSVFDARAIPAGPARPGVAALPAATRFPRHVRSRLIAAPRHRVQSGPRWGFAQLQAHAVRSSTRR